MHGDRGNRRTEKATSQNIFEMTKIRDRSFVTSRGGGGGGRWFWTGGTI